MIVRNLSPTKYDDLLLLLCYSYSSYYYDYYNYYNYYCVAVVVGVVVVVVVAVVVRNRSGHGGRS